MPQDTVLPFSQPDNAALRRAQFANKHLWVTAYEYRSASTRPASTPTSTPAATACRPGPRPTARSEKHDLVLSRSHRSPRRRPELAGDAGAPTVGSSYRADGFFDGNPALDVPPAEHCHHEG